MSGPEFPTETAWRIGEYRQTIMFKE